MVKILDYDIGRNGYTRHGQHLNLAGKAKVVQPNLLIPTLCQYPSNGKQLLTSSPLDVKLRAQIIIQVI